MTNTAGRRFVSPRVIRYFQLGIDFFLGIVCVLLAYLVRFDAVLPQDFARQMLIIGPMIATARIFVNWFLGVYRVFWRYVGIREVVLFVRAVASLSAVLLAMRLLIPNPTSLLKIPISIIIMEGTFFYLGLTGTRLLRRMLNDSQRSQSENLSTTTATVLVGAGQNGLTIAKESLKNRAHLGIHAVGFVDDDATKAGMELCGLTVLGSLDQIQEVIKRTDAKQVLITSSAISSKSILQLIDQCRPMAVEVRTVQGLLELLDSGLSAQSLRDVRIEDLLSRDPVPLSMSMSDLRFVFSGKRIMVTGAGGSIGKELCRQLMALDPETLLLVERDENNLFEVHREVVGNGQGIALLADIQDRKELHRIFKEHQPQVVFHAAAFKHVPMMERFPTESAKNNVFGTKTLAELSDEHGVDAFLMISTDKAVNPSSVMGATKRMAEVIIQNLAPKSRTKFSCVRFGNVLGSRGSVIPIFREQIRKGGPVTVTHVDAMRYFMTIPEAANLVIQASTLGDSGEVFVLDMGQPVKIIDLARQMIYLSGASEEQVPIQISGSRPGEKLFEELRTEAEGISNTRLRKVYRVQPEEFDATQVAEILQRMDFAIRAIDHDGIRAALEDLGIGFVKKRSRMITGTTPRVRPPSMA